MTALEPSPTLTKPAQRGRLRDTALIFIFAFACFALFSLGMSPLAGTEGHRAITAHQMLQRHNYLIPSLYGYTYLKKPPLHYWILAGFERAFGPWELFWRLPSALAAALMAAFVGFMTGRWFDRIAGYAAGIACVALVPLWSQSRSADIDANNTFATVAAALCLIEIAWNPDSKGWLWTHLAGLFLGAALLLKFHACLPVIVGAIVAPRITSCGSACATPRRSAGGAAGLFFQIISLCIGIALLASWWIPAKIVLHSTNAVPDTGGVDEAIQRMIITDLPQLARAILLPPTVLLYAMPVSLALIFPLHPGLRKLYEPKHQSLMLILTGAVFIAFAIDLLSGMTNPRYAYPNLPLLCPLVGAISYGWNTGRFDEPLRRFLHLALAIVIASFAIADGVIMYLAWKNYILTLPMRIFAPIALLAAILAIHRISRNRLDHACAGMLLLIGILSMSYAQYKNQERYARSAYKAAFILHEIVGESATVTTWYTLWAQPELFYYAAVQVNPRPLNASTDLPNGGWVVFFSKEWAAWSSKSPERFARVTELPIDLRNRPDKDLAYLVWCKPISTTQGAP